jgi:hypothetical protein
MDSGYRSPLVDLVRRGDAEQGVRMAAARGALGLPALDQLALLLLLLDDPDIDIARQAQATIDKLPATALGPFLARADVPEAMRQFFAARGVYAAPGDPSTAASPVAPEPLPGDHPDQAIDEEAGAAASVLSSLPILARIKLATRGTREQRAQLIRDPNRLVAAAALSSPKVNESEIEVFAKMASVSEDILRLIGANRTWMKHYGVAHGLVRNPKTPPAMSMQLLNRLTARDVRAVTTDRNVPESVRLAARRILARGQK